MATVKDHRYQSLRGQQTYMLCPSNIEAMMTGVQYANQDRKGNVTLTYTDGTTETANCADMQLLEAASFMAVVGTVQERARTGLRIKWTTGEPVIPE